MGKSVEKKKSTSWLHSYLVKGQCEEGEEEELTCAGIVIDPDEARMANAHEGARRVDAHGVLPAVVLPFGTLVNIWKGSGQEEENSQASRGIESKTKEKNSFLSFSELSVSGIPSQFIWGGSEGRHRFKSHWNKCERLHSGVCCCTNRL